MAQAAGAARRAGFGPEFNSSMSDIFEDLFGDFMGGGGGQRTSQRGRGGGGARAVPISATTWKFP